MPLIDLPVVLQHAGHDCGDGVYGSVTLYYEERRRRTKCDPWRGKHPFDLEPEFRRAGYRTASGQFTLLSLRALTAAGVPVCCLVQRDGCGHWVAVRGVQRGRVYLMDPADGYRSVKVDEWLDLWHDTDHYGTVYRNHGLTVEC